MHDWGEADDAASLRPSAEAVLALSEPRASPRPTVGTGEGHLDGLPQVRPVPSGFDLGTLESITRSSSERNRDTEAGRTIIVGPHDYDNRLIVIRSDVHGDTATPVSAGAITRHQLRSRLRTGRISHGNDLSPLLRGRRRAPPCGHR